MRTHDLNRTRNRILSIRDSRQERREEYEDTAIMIRLSFEGSFAKDINEMGHYIGRISRELR